jgi:GNAT superfamily N-acetyltransferase
MTDITLAIQPLTPERWNDLETLFGKQGAQSGCWCMWWRRPGSEFFNYAGEKNRVAFKSIVDSGNVPGLLAYHEDRPVGWCSIAPREEFAPRFNKNARVYKPIDDLPVWSVVCFYIAKDYRGQNVATHLLHAAVDYAREHGAETIEAYAKDIGEAQMKDALVFTGTPSMYLEAGFEIVARRTTTITMLILRRSVK